MDSLSSLTFARNCELGGGSTDESVRLRVRPRSAHAERGIRACPARAKHLVFCGYRVVTCLRTFVRPEAPQGKRERKNWRTMTYVSPWSLKECSGGARMVRMLAMLEPDQRIRLERAEAPYTVAQWVSGGHTRDGRARRTEVALYVRARRISANGCEGWPKTWLMTHFAKIDALHCERRRSRGLPRQSVHESCDVDKLIGRGDKCEVCGDDHKLPSASSRPAPTRSSEKSRRETDLRSIVASQAKIAQDSARLAALAVDLLKKKGKSVAE